MIYFLYNLCFMRETDKVLNTLLNIPLFHLKQKRGCSYLEQPLSIKLN